MYGIAISVPRLTIFKMGAFLRNHGLFGMVSRKEKTGRIQNFEQTCLDWRSYFWFYVLIPKC